MTTARQRATSRLVASVTQQRHPSHQMLDRLEGSLRTKEDLEAYTYLLDVLIGDQRHPSPRMLDRIDRAALVHELLDARENDQEQDDS